VFIAYARQQLLSCTLLTASLVFFWTIIYLTGAVRFGTSNLIDFKERTGGITGNIRCKVERKKQIP